MCLNIKNNTNDDGTGDWQAGVYSVCVWCLPVDVRTSCVSRIWLPPMELNWPNIWTYENYCTYFNILIANFDAFPSLYIYELCHEYGCHVISIWRSRDCHSSLLPFGFHCLLQQPPRNYRMFIFIRYSHRRIIINVPCLRIRTSLQQKQHYIKLTCPTSNM